MLLLLPFVLCELDSTDDRLAIYTGKLLDPENSLVHYDSNFFTFCRYSQDLHVKTGVPLIQKFFDEEYNDIGIHFRFRQWTSNTNLCLRGLLDSDYKSLKNAVEKGLVMEFILDDIVATAPLGKVDGVNVMYFSHWKFNIHFKEDSIMSFTVECKDPRDLQENGITEWYYSIDWISTNSTSIQTNPSRVVGFSNVRNEFISLMKLMLYIVMFVALFVIILVLRLNKDLDGVGKDSNFDDFEAPGVGEHSWKVLHGDVFRSPARVEWLAAVTGTGFHIIITVALFLVVNMVFGLYRLVSINVLLVMSYVASSIVSGYIASSVGTSFGKHNDSVIVKNMVFGINMVGFGLTLFVSMFAASEITKYAAFKMIAMNCVLVAPCAFFGANLGSKAPLFDENPCQPAAVPRRGPKRTLTTHPVFLWTICGSVCAIVFLRETKVILLAMKKEMLSWMFLFVIFTILGVVIVSATVSVAATYVLLSKEIHCWQWTAFAGPFASSVIVFIYSVQFIITKTYLRETHEKIIYITYALILALLYGLVCGASGFISSNIFVRTLFANLKFE